MDARKIVNTLKKRYPGKNIVLNTPEYPLEIVCELDPVSQTRAVAVIDYTRPHYHHKNTETYEVIRGELKVILGDQEIILHKGESFVIKPGIIHSAVGQETWINVHSDPGWNLADHILVKNVDDRQNKI